MATIETVDKRLTELETFVWEIPVLLNTRTERYEAEFTDIRNRFEQLDRAMNLIQVDMRDLRNGVARFTAEADKRMRGLESKVKALDVRVGKREVRWRRLSRRSTKALPTSTQSLISSCLDSPVVDG